MANRRKILIEGAPGTGKTMTASIIASELNMPLYTVQVDKLVTKFMGETSVKLRQIFDAIGNIKGVYFFDEFDAIGADRGIDNEVGEMRRILNSFLQFLEQDNSDSIIIAATNNQKILDKALFRRFDDVLHYSMPSYDDVIKLFNVKLEVFSSGFLPSKTLMERAVFLSHAEISRVCDDAIKNAILTSTKEINQEYLMMLVNERLNVYEKAAV
jgi:AAA+ superfamily predicted ATPase